MSKLKDYKKKQELLDRYDEVLKRIKGVEQMEEAQLFSEKDEGFYLERDEFNHIQQSLFSFYAKQLKEIEAKFNKL